MSRTSRLHDSKNNECLALRACTTQESMTVWRFALARLKKLSMSRISCLHGSENNESLAFSASTARKAPGPRISRMSRLQATTAARMEPIVWDASCKPWSVRGETSCIISLILGTREPRDKRTKGPEYQRTTGPEDQGTRGPRDQRTKGPGDQTVVVVGLLNRKAL